MQCHKRPLILAVAWAVVVLLSFSSIDGVSGQLLYPVAIDSDIRLSLLLFAVVLLIEMMTCIVFGYGVPKKDIPCQMGKKAWLALCVLSVFVVVLFFANEMLRLFMVFGILCMLVLTRHLTLAEINCPQARTRELA